MVGSRQAEPAPRRRRANGEASRERILDAAAAIAGERGFEGTSINLVSERSGLPPSSIYWHFHNKDELIAAVIDRSWDAWTAMLDRPAALPSGASPADVFHHVFRHTGRALVEFPDFLRLGLMLILENRPEEPTARAKFVQSRNATAARVRVFYDSFFAGLAATDITSLVTLTIALADGLFIAREADELDLADSFDLVATAILGAAEQLRST
jgi:AcrR family transcriptional regulator